VIQHPESVEYVLRECRFVSERRVLATLLPGIEHAVPPLQELRFQDGDEPVFGYPVLTSEPLTKAVHALASTQLARCLDEPSYLESVPALTAEQLRADPYARVLGDLWARARANGGFLNLGGVLHLRVAGILCDFFHPRDPIDGDARLADLRELRSSDPRRHARVKDRVLRSLLTRGASAIAAVDDLVGGSEPDPLGRAMVANRLVFTEKPEGLYERFDLAEMFHARDWGLDHSTWSDLHRLLRGCIEAAHERDTAGDGNSRTSWFFDRFSGPELLTKASCLEIGGEEDGSLGARIAWLLSLQEDSVRYLAHHIEDFRPGRRVPRAVKGRFKTSAAVLQVLEPYLEVCREVLRWDFLNTLRGFVEPVETRAGLLSLRGDVLEVGTSAIDFAGTGELIPRRRRGTCVATEIAEFTETVEAMLLQGEVEDRTPVAAADGDFAALCLQAVYAIRSNLSAWKGTAQSFSEGRTLDLFDRALDALRYAVVLREHVLGRREQAPGPFRTPRANPFSRALRIGITTGDYAAVAIPDPWSGRNRWDATRATGPLVADAYSLLIDAPGLRPGKNDSDPLGIFNVAFEHGDLHNEGICSGQGTFDEVVGRLHAERIPAWTPTSGDVRIAGESMELGAYRLELVFEDEVIERVVLVRRLPGLPGVTDGSLYEYIAMESEVFRTFLVRVRCRLKPPPKKRRRAPLQPHRPRPRGEDPELGPRSAEGRFQGGTAILGAARASSGSRDPDADGTMPPGLISGEQSRPQGAGGDAPGAQHLLDEGVPSAFPPAFEPADLGAIELPEPAPALLPPRMDRISTFDDFVAPHAPALLDDSFDEPLEVELPAAAEEVPSAEPVIQPESDAAMDFIDLFDGFADDGQGLAGAPGEILGGLSDPGSPPGSREGIPMVEATPRSRPVPETLQRRRKLPSGPSLLGPVESDLAERIAVVERRRYRDRRGRDASSGRAHPDFSVLFKDYVVFWVGQTGSQGVWLGIGRRYRDVLFDLHRFPVSDRPAGWGPDDAIVEFLRVKAATNYAPQSLSYERVPAGAQAQKPLTVERLRRAFDRLGDAE
jgi:hypothetical protein